MQEKSNLIIPYFSVIFCFFIAMHKKHVQIKETPFGYTSMHKKHVQIKERNSTMNTQALFEEYRAGILECIHYGTVCAVNSQGILASAGDTDWLCFYRSASKPIQSLPVLLHGLDKKYGLTEEETAIFSGSHWADEDHVRILESVLAKTELKEDQMVMLPTYPNRAARKEQLIGAHMPMRKIYHNCSGKHLGMMLLARELGEPVEDYWKRESKAQKEILEVISQMTDVPASHIRIGVDGCGVPVYAVPFYTIATSYLRLSQPELIKDISLRNAVENNMNILHKYPNMIAGKDIICSILTSSPDLIGKSGALGVYAIGIRSLGLGIAAKIIDGSHDEFAAIVLQVFDQLGYHDSRITEKIKEAYSDIILNDNREEVGFRKAVFRLTHET